MEQTCQVCTAALLEDPGVTAQACPACLAKLQQALATLPTLYVQLHTELPNNARGRPNTARTAHLPWKYRPTPSPLRMPLLIHAEHTVHTVRRWALQALPASVPTTPVRPGHLLQNLCKALAQELPNCVRPPTQPREPQAVWDAYLRALHLLDLTEQPQRLAMPCPACDLRSLHRDATGTTCYSCQAFYPAISDRHSNGPTTKPLTRCASTRRQHHRVT